MFAANLTVAAHAFSKKFRSRIFPLLCLSLACVLPSAAQVQFVGAQSSAPAVGLNLPFGVAVDTSGDLYIADTFNDRVVKIDPTGTQTLVAITVVPGLSRPHGVAIDKSGNLYISDGGNNRIVKVPPNGGMQTSFGTALDNPQGIAVDSAGNLFFADGENSTVYRISAGGVQTTFGVGFSQPSDVAVDGAGNVYVADDSMSAIVEISPDGMTQMNVGSGLVSPTGVTVDGAGNVYAVETGGLNTDVVEITTAGPQFTLAISGLVSPLYPAIDANYNLFVPDLGPSAVVEFSTETVNLGTANVCDNGVVGTCMQTATLNFTVTADTVANVALVSMGASKLDFTSSVSTCTGATSPCTVQVEFTPYFPGVRPGAVILTDGDGVLTAVPLYGTGLGAAVAFDPPTVDPTVTGFSIPFAVAADGNGILNGNIYVLNAQTCQVFMTDALSSFNTAVAGSGTCSTGDASQSGVAATSIRLAGSSAIALDGAGNIYIAEDQNSLIRKVDTTGIITTVAGNQGAGSGFSGDGGPATSAQIDFPEGVAVDGAGNLYFSDSTNNRIRKVDLAGIITTVAGSSNTGGFGGDNGPATSALLNDPTGVSTDSAGNIYIADTVNNVIRKVDTSGIITTVAGDQALGAGSSGNGSHHQRPTQLSHLGCRGRGWRDIHLDDTLHRVDGAGNINTYSATTALSNPKYVIADGSGSVAVADSGIHGVVPIDRTTAGLPSFGTQTISTSSAAQDLTVTDSGNQSLAISLITPSTDFNLSGSDTSCSTSMPQGVGLDCILGIEFLPTGIGALPEDIGLTDNALGPDCGAMQEISVDGTGQVPLTTTTTTVSSLPDGSSTFGQSVTFTATVSPAPSGSPYGTGQFLDGVTTIAASQTVDNTGVATFTTSALLGGGHTLTAVYSGNGDSGGSTSGTFSFTVNTAASTTTLAALPSVSSAFGQSVTLTANVSSLATGTLTGTVTFMYGSSAIGSPIAVSSGSAQLMTTALPPGAQNLTAVYSGDTNFTTSTSNTISYDVVGAASSTTLAVSPVGSSTFGQNVTLTATVSSLTAGTLTGTVTFKSGSITVGSPVTVVSGSAQLVTAALAGGAQSLSAIYSGDTDFGGSSSNTVSFTVNPADSTTALTAAPNPSNFGQSVTLSATITSLVSGTATGTVTFKSNGTAIGSPVTVTAGSAQLVTAALAAGAQSLTAVYSGDANFATSTSNTVSDTVTQLTTTVTTLGVSPNPAVVGQTVTFTVTVTPTPTGESLGTVNFLSGTTLLGSVNMNSTGIVTFTSTGLTTGADSLTAMYSGNSVDAASTSSATTENVNPPTVTTTTLTVSPNPVISGQTATFTATVAPAPTGSSLGTVTFFSGTTQLGSGNMTSTGIVTFTSTTLATGALNLTATYSGDATSAASTSSAFSETVSAGYAIDASQTPIPTAPGGDAEVSVTVPPIGGAYNSIVVMSASGLPPGAVAVFNPPTVTPGTAGAKTMLTIQLPKPIAMVPPSRKWPFPPGPLSLVLALCGILYAYTRPKRLRLTFAMLLLMGTTMMMMMGCNGGFGAPTVAAGNYVITVTGTSGSLHASTTVTLVVQ